MSRKDCVIEDKTYYLKKDSDGKVHTTKELQTIILEAALEVDRICRKHNIPYALSFGSALGIYNYQGFIPWDDDIDIVIPFEYLQNFVNACKTDLNDKYAYECYENNEQYNVIIPTGKIRIKNTYLREYSFLTLPAKCGNGETIFVDICAIMGVPEDIKEQQRLIRRARRRAFPYITLDGIFRRNPKKLKDKIKNEEKQCFEDNKESSLINQTPIIPWQPMPKKEKPKAFPRDVIYPFREYDFEGHKLYSFNNIKEFCLIFFGEKALRKWDGEKWIDPFPIHKRKGHHILSYNLYHSKKKGA